MENRLWRQAHGSFFLALAVFFAPAALFAANFSATLDRDNVLLGESATLSLTFEGGSPKSPPAIPGIANVRIAFGGQSSSFNLANGQMSSSVTYNYSLTPIQPGEFTIPPIQVVVDGQTLRTQPIKLIATRTPPVAANGQGAENQIAFLKLALPKKEVYLGEVIPAEVQVYYQDVVQNIDQFQMSPLNPDGFTAGKTIQGQRHQLRIGNSSFLMVPLVSTLSPVKTGDLTVGQVDCTMVLQLPSNNRNRDAFDPFGMFQRTEARRVTLSTEAETIRVLPLPTENVPPDFNNAVGDFSFAMSAAPTNVAVGDPITIKIQISGRGALDAVTLPKQLAWREFKAYPPTSKVETTDALGLQGTKTFEQVIVPQNTEVRELPAVSFSFFDPEKKMYRTVTQPAVPLTVRPSAASPSPTILSAKTPEKAPPAQELVPIKQRLGSVAEMSAPLAQQTWFLALQSVPVLAWAGLLIHRKRSEALANNPRLRRERQVAQFVRDGLAELRQHAAANQSDDFFATLFRLLQEQLGERLDVPASAITEAVIEERLRPRRVADETLTALHELFQTCNLARYAPVQSSHELEAIIPKLETVINEVKHITT